MPIRFTSLRKPRALFVALLTLLSIALILSVWSLGAKSRVQQSSTLLVTNQTKTFQIISTERIGEYFRVRARNVSQRAINGYSILLDDGGSIDCDYTISEHVIAPGDEEEFVVPVTSNYSPKTSAPQQTVDLSAAVFVDGSSEGEQKAADSIIKRRVGVKTQLKRILPLLQEMIDSQEGDWPVKLDRLRTRISLLAEQQENGQPLEVRHGLRDAKDEILTLMQNLKQRQQTQGYVDWRSELFEMIRQSEKRLARL